MAGFIERNMTFIKYTLVLLLCYVRIGTFFCIEMLTGLQGAFLKVYDMNLAQYNLLFSIYTWANIIVSIFGGFVIDRILGKRIGLLVCVLSVVLGIAVFTVGAGVGSFPTMLVGRFMMGLGISSSMNVGNAILSVWFPDKVTFALALLSSSGRVGAALGLLIPNLIYIRIKEDTADSKFGLALTLIFGLLLNLAGLCASVIVAILDYKGVKYLPKQNTMGSSSIIVDGTAKKFTVRDLKEFSFKFWLAALGCSIFYGAFFGFVANGQLFLVRKFDYNYKEANYANFLIFAAPVLAAPIIGIVIEMVGYNTSWGILGTVIGLITHVVYNVDNSNKSSPYILAVVLSFSYSFFGIAIFVLPSYIVRPHQLTSAYSLYSVFWSIMVSVISISSGAIIDGGGFMFFEVYMVWLHYIILIIMIALAVYDYYSRKRQVNKPGTSSCYKDKERISLLVASASINR